MILIFALKKILKLWLHTLIKPNILTLRLPILVCLLALSSYGKATSLDSFERDDQGSAHLFSERVSKIDISVSDEEKIENQFFNTSEWISNFRDLYKWFLGSDKEKQQNFKFTVNLECLPEHLIKVISTYLDPPNIVRLSNTSTSLRVFFNTSFWILYNLNSKYQIFHEVDSYFIFWNSKKEVQPLKVTLANYYYQLSKAIDQKGEKLRAMRLLNKVNSFGLKLNKCNLCTNHTFDGLKFCSICMMDGVHVKNEM